MLIPFSNCRGAAAVVGGGGFMTSDDEGGPVYAFTDISGTGTELVNFVEDDSGDPPLANRDEGKDTFTLSGAWSFPFFGETFTQMWVTANGYVDFSNVIDPYYVTGFDARPFPNTRYNDNRCLAALGKDLDFTAHGSIYWQEFSDRVVVQWEDGASFGVPTSSLTFQVILWATGQIHFVYETLDFSTDADPNDLAVGLQKDSTTGLDIAHDPAAFVKSNFLVEIPPQL